ncbi:MAG: hypothetical protein WBQ23_01170 [Bacteroidota bacterium]
MKRTILLMLFLVGLQFGASAQDVTVSAKVDSNRYMIGQWITLHLTIDAPTKYTLHLPMTDDDFENGDFVSAEKAEEELRGEIRQYRQDVVATVFDTGSIALRVRVQYSTPGDTSVFTVFSQVVQLEITTVALDTAQSFKDIKNVLHIPLTIWDYLLYAGAVLLLLLLSWLGYRWYQKRKALPVEADVEPEPEIPPHIIALQSLSALRERKLWQSGEHKPYQSQVTDILRMYIERRYRLPAMEQPTSELMPGLALLGLAPHTVERVEQVLRTADLTKFAKYTPSSMQHEDAMTVSVQFVESTKPLASATPVAVPAPGQVTVAAPESSGHAVSPSDPTAFQAPDTSDEGEGERDV